MAYASQKAPQVNPYADPTPPPTALQADQQNRVGNQNRKDTGQAYWEQTQQTQQQEQAQQQAQQQAQAQLTYAERARQEAEQRARYTNPNNLGDARTQAMVKANRMMRMAGYDVPDDDTMMGVTLESQRQGALLTPGTQDERYYENERDKWNANAIETSSAYHYMGKRTGVEIPANPYENRGDVALALEKGGNQKDFTPKTYGFNPNVGSMLGILPNGKGFQESEWDTAAARYKGKAAPAPVSFMDAINYQAAQQGRMGVYGNLKGGVKDTAPNVPVVNRNTGSGELGMFTQQGAKATEGKPLSKGWNPFVASAATPSGYISEGIQLGQSKPQPTPTFNNLPRSTFDSYAQGISKTMQPFNPIGAAVMSIFGGDMLKGWNTFGLKNQYEDTVAKQSPILDSLLPSYEAGVVGFNANKTTYESAQKGYNANATRYQSDMDVFNGTVSKFNSRVTAFNLNPTNVTEYNSILGEESSIKARQGELNSTRPLSEYNSLQGMYGNLTAEKNALDTKKSMIDAAYAPIESAKSKYDAAAMGMVGNVDQKSLFTYNAGTWLQDMGTGYQKRVSEPVGNALKPIGSVGQFITGVVQTPGQIASLGGQSVIGGETLVRGNINNFAGLTVAGLAITGKGMYDMATTNPAGLAGNLAGMAILTGGVRVAGRQGLGLVRARNMEYVPIESIGYDSKLGYPLKPAKTTSSDLLKSFGEGKLYPRPTEMSATNILTKRPISPPYLHGEGGIPVARLPNAKANAGEFTLFTAHESRSLAGGVKVGEAYKMTGTGTSELDAISAAPVLEGYFAKVGGQIPKSIGFESPFRTPTVYSTLVPDLETVPARVRNSLPLDARGKITDYTNLNNYLQKQAATRPGVGYIPMIKGEYEANIVTNSIFEVTGRNYYTKLGGVGKSHFGGTRVPIVEQRLVGFEPAEIATKVARRTSSGSYSPSPYLNLFDVSAGVGIAATQYSNLGTPSASRIAPMGSLSSGIRKTYPTSTAAYSPREISASSQFSNLAPRSHHPSSNPSSISSMLYSKATTKLSSLSGSSLATTLKYSSPSSYKKSPVSSEIYSPLRSIITTPPRTPKYSELYSPKYSPLKSPTYTPLTTPLYSTGYTPLTTPPITPVITPSIFPGWGSGGGSEGRTGKHGRIPWREKIPLRSMLFSKAPAAPKKDSFTIPKLPEKTFYRAVGKGKIVAVESAVTPRRVATRKAAPRSKKSMFGGWL